MRLLLFSDVIFVATTAEGKSEIKKLALKPSMVQASSTDETGMGYIVCIEKSAYC